MTTRKWQNILNEEFTLCYKSNRYVNLWNCECGYKSVGEVDKRTHEIHKLNSEIITTFFPTYNLIPMFIQKQMIKIKLMPGIKIKSKPE